MTDPRLIGIAMLFIAIITSALGVVYSKHYSRTLFVDLQQLRDERDALQVEWGRLRLEESTWAAHGRIEGIASEELDMQLPTDSVSIISHQQ